MHRDDDGIVEIHDRDVARSLPREDVPLCRDVALTRAVVVEMVLAHIRHDRDVGAHAERLELKARELEEHDVALCEPVELLDDGAADVASGDHAARTALQDALEHGGGRGLPLRPGDADDRRRAEAEEETHLGEHRDVALQRAEDRGRPRADAGDHEDVVGIGQREVIAGRTEDELHRCVAEARDALRAFIARRGIADRHPRAARDEKSREALGGPAATEPDDRHALAAELVPGDRRVEEHRHGRRRPRKPSCVP